MLTRRQFVKWLAATGLSSTSIAALLEAAGCASPQQATPTRSAIKPTAIPPTQAAPKDTTMPAVTASPSSAAPPITPAPPSPATYLSVAHGDDPAEITRQAIKAIGGIERFVQPGQSVIVKQHM